MDVEAGEAGEEGRQAEGAPSLQGPLHHAVYVLLSFLRVWGLGFGVEGSVKDIGFRIQGLWLGVEGPRSRVTKRCGLKF